MIYLILFFILMVAIVIKIEQKIIASKYLIKRVHKYRHKTRTERIERRKEIEEYKKSLTHKYYVDKKLKDPELQKMIDKNKYKSLDAFRFEARLFYYGFFISILFGFIFTITGLYKDEFISSLYPYIEPYFKVFYHNFEKYTFNPLSFKVCFSWILVFSCFMIIIISFYIFKYPQRTIYFGLIDNTIKRNLIALGIGCFLSIFIFHTFNSYHQGYYMKLGLYKFPISFGIYFIFIIGFFTSILLPFAVFKQLINKFSSCLKGKCNV